MILTHFLALIASPALLVSPAAAVLPLASSEPSISGGQLGLTLVTALKVRSATAVLPVRER
jgi:hypothetical protein